jgi:antitoxin component YwqK of YwqJK toxin-antitoxin module
MQSKFNLALLLFLFCSFFHSVSAQVTSKNPQEVTFNSKKYFVYPYGVKAIPTSAITSTVFFFPEENFKKIIQNENPEITDEEFNFTMNQFQNYMKRFSKDKRFKAMQEMYKYILGKTDHFFNATAELDVDIIPSLDLLPDGKYIQYYENFFHIDAHENLTFDTTRIAGFFELKNNLLHGKATWISVLGDTLKSGEFTNGLKQGKWVVNNQLAKAYSKKQAELIYKSPREFSTNSFTYLNGVLNGPSETYLNSLPISKGHYTNGEKSGEWYDYEVVGKFVNNGMIDTVFLHRHYTLASTKQISKKPLIRNAVFESEPRIKGFDFPYDIPYVNFLNLVDFQAEKEEDLELPEEKLGYDNEFYGEEMYGEEMYFEDGGYSDFEDEKSIYLNGKYIEKSKLIDSIGYRNLFEGVYEEFYENGQLKFRYTFKNGELVAEDTVFWDNGKPANTVIWNEKENRYDEKMYDYNSKVFGHITYDSKGKLLKTIRDPYDNKEYVFIDGLKAKELKGGNYNDPYIYFEFGNSDTLDHPLMQALLLNKSWYSDTTVDFYQMYDPISRTIIEKKFSILGNEISTTTKEFGEDFSNLAFKKTTQLNRFSIESVGNAIYQDYNYLMYGIQSNDSNLQSRVKLSDFSFNLTTDETYLFDKKPFTGKVSFKFDGKKNEIKTSKSSVSVEMNTSDQKYDKWKKDLKNYWKTKKTKFKNYNSWATINQEPTTDIFTFFPFLNSITKNEEKYSEFEEAQLPYSKITGSMANGKPTGEWRGYNSENQITLICNFLNGELQGDYKTFDVAFPKAKKSNEYTKNNYISDITDNENPAEKYFSYPEKKTYYLKSDKKYNKGIQVGAARTYDWTGKVTSFVNFVDGYEQGPGFEQNPIAITRYSYEDGVLDGIVTTYLTLPGRDSILLYELNFQNGMLQGESKSYHANGKLSKRGFFLNGQPIDDYEGYDTLGFKYHYVKFNYSFPVEEKIYELNELSVRYQFDWKDSIYFRPDDLTNSTSIDNLLYQEELLGDAYEEPYYGRESLVEKFNIKYHMTKYFPNDTVARDGDLKGSKKIGNWYFNSYDGERLHEILYFDTILKVNDSIKFKSKGIITDLDSNGKAISKSYLIERIEKYDCSHTDHYEVRQYYTIWQAHDSVGRMNGFVKNYYDNGTLQSEGMMQNGLPTGVWKLYDPNGKLHQVGEYVQGKRNGRWLSGDLSKTKYLGDICMNPNLPDLEERIETQEKMLNISIRYFQLGKIKNTEFYDLNLNKYEKKETKKSGIIQENTRDEEE